MAKVLRCGDLMPGCQVVIEGQDVTEVMKKGADHAKAAHGMTSIPPDLAKKVQAAGGKVVAPPFDVGEQGRMAAFQDPSGAVISAWQGGAMNSQMPIGEANTFGWAELSARGVDKAIPFYQKVFGWTPKANDMGPGQPAYTEFQLGGESVAGGQEMQAMVPPQVPSYWLVYFTVADVDKSFKTATQAGARELVAPMEFPGGRFAILTDPQGASFGLLKMAPR